MSFSLGQVRVLIRRLIWILFGSQDTHSVPWPVYREKCRYIPVSPMLKVVRMFAFDVRLYLLRVSVRILVSGQSFMVRMNLVRMNFIFYFPFKKVSKTF